MNPSEFNPLKDDILLKLRPTHTQTSTIWFEEDTSDNDIQYFHVVAVGPDVKHVNKGDLVIASWKRITPPFALDTTKKEYGITSEKEILAIWEE